MSISVCLHLPLSHSVFVCCSISPSLCLSLYLYLPFSVCIFLSLCLPISVVFLQKGLDLFSVLDVMGNSCFLEKLKFVPSKDYLHYYLYNWACPTIHPDKVRLTALSTLNSPLSSSSTRLLFTEMYLQ